MSLTTKANTPPIADSGTAVKMRIVCPNDLNVAYSRPIINNRAMGTAIESLFLALVRFSNCPP
ncbi:hypothetical protein D3C85_1937190 [compost metagenome]